MVKYRRAHCNNPDALYFITYVTKERNHYFKNRTDFVNQWIAWKETSDKANAELYAFVFLPDHSHIILRQGQRSFSESMRMFKRRSNWFILPEGGTIWQPRFWEHLIRDDKDLQKHADYIHYNPVRHGLVKRPRDYPYSSFKLFVKRELYADNWADDIEIKLAGEPK